MVLEGSKQYNKQFNYLLTASSDGLINYWELKLNQYRIYFQYSLKKHEKSVTGLTLNQTQDILVSCGEDNKIIVWGKKQNQKMQNQLTWQFLYIVKQSVNSFGKKIQFLTQNIFICVQHDQEYVHVFELKQDLFVEQKQKKIKLLPSANDNFDFNISHIQKGVVCFGHGQNVYILSVTSTQELILSADPIGSNQLNKMVNFCGAVSGDGKYLVIWTPNSHIYELMF